MKNLKIIISSLLLGLGSAWAADLATLRMAVIHNSAPMSYLNDAGVLTGFNVELGKAMCETMQVRCTAVVVPLSEVVEQVAKGQVDFAAVSLLITPERRSQVIFSKPYYRSLSAWVAKSGVKPGTPNLRVAVVKGSIQAHYAEAQQWKRVETANHTLLAETLTSGKADAALFPMLTGLAFVEDKGVARNGWTYTLMSDAAIAGDVGISISPQRPELRERIDNAIDQLKRDGRFDKINNAFLPFKLQ